MEGRQTFEMFRHLDRERLDQGSLPSVSGYYCQHMHTKDDSTKFFNMAAIGGTVAQEHCGGFSFENCKR